MKKLIDKMVNIPYNNYDKRCEIEVFRKSNGECPVEDFIRSIKDKKLIAKTLRTIQLLEINGHELSMPFCRLLEDGIYELRTKQSSNITRVLYFFFRGDVAVLTNGFVKKSDKTPREEIDRAKRYRSMYLNTKEKE